MRDLYDLSSDQGDEQRWLVAVEGIVAINEDPEHQQRIKCIIPVIDEDRICEKWIRRLVGLWVGPQGFGDSHAPARGAEVAIFGRLGQKHNLYYVPVYNEDYLVAEELRGSDVRGLKTDRDYKQLVGRDLLIKAERHITLEAEGEIRLIADKVSITAPAGLWVNGVQMFVP